MEQVRHERLVQCLQLATRWRSRKPIAEVRRILPDAEGSLVIVLAILTAVAAPAEGIRLVSPGLAIAMSVAALLDALILRMVRGAWEFPSGALLTGLIVAMILTPQEPWFVPACTSAIAVLSKYLFRTRSANIFNPAALAIVVTFYPFHTGQNWWGVPCLMPGPVALRGAVRDRRRSLPIASTNFRSSSCFSESITCSSLRRRSWMILDESRKSFEHPTSRRFFSSRFSS